MTIVIGLAPGEHGAAAVQLGAMLARSAEDNVVVAAVVPTPWPPNPYREDTEYLLLQETAAERALEEARQHVGDALAVDFVVHRASSVSSGLLEVALQRNATLVALGSSSRGLSGLVSLGGVAERILHSADIPVTLAPQGFRAGPHARVSRITVGFGRADHDSDLLATAGATAKRIGARLRVACFAVRPMTAYTGSIEESAEDLVVDEWVKHLEVDIARALTAPATPEVDAAGSDADPGSLTAPEIDIAVGQGDSWAEALGQVSWAEGDVLAIGTSSSAVSRFFLGSHASKIVRHARVPVVLMPRSGVESD